MAEDRPAAVAKRSASTAQRREFPVDGNRPLARVGQTQASVHARPDGASEQIAMLESGDVVEIQQVWQAGGGWLEIRGERGLGGYLHGQTLLGLLTRVRVLDPEAVVYLGAPDGPAFHCPAGESLWIEPDESQPGFVAVRHDNGKHGWLSGDTKIAALPDKQVNVVPSGNRDIGIGAAWLGGGLVVTLGTYSVAAEAGGGSYLVCWGAILFGGIQFLRGLVAAGRAPQPREYGPPMGR